MFNSFVFYCASAYSYSYFVNYAKFVNFKCSKIANQFIFIFLSRHQQSSSRSSVSWSTTSLQQPPNKQILQYAGLTRSAGLRTAAALPLVYCGGYAHCYCTCCLWLVVACWPFLFFFSPGAWWLLAPHQCYPNYSGWRLGKPACSSQSHWLLLVCVDHTTPQMIK